MNTILESKLCMLAPTLFSDRYEDMKTTALCWGFECGDGWYELLKEAAQKLEPLCKAEYDKYKHLEKSWYKYVRTLLTWSRKVGLFTPAYWIVIRLLPNLNNPISWYGGPPRASQVKEKYGTLRFYMTHSTYEMQAIIDNAQKHSARTCEECGRPGKIRGREWYYTRCLKCWRELSAGE